MLIKTLLEKKIVNFNQIILKGEHFYGAIRDMNWYLLSHKEIQIYQLLLHHSQKRNVFLIADIKELNMETCLSVSYIHY